MTKPYVVGVNRLERIQSDVSQTPEMTLRAPVLVQRGLIGGRSSPVECHVKI